ncbi:MAG: sulfite exporter TauE/SafE family protein [Opitutaceae bacterium]
MQFLFARVGGETRIGAMTAGDYFALLLMGLLGTGHCIGMCGPFAITAGGGGATGAVLGRSLAYHAGKTLTYVFLAVLFSVIGGWVAGGGALPWLQNAMSAVVGTAMIALGLAYALELRLSSGAARWIDGSRWCGAAVAILRAPTWWRALLVGWLNGFLPCGLSLMALVYAAGFGSAAAAALGAMLFGAATAPGLVLTALLGAKLFSGDGRRWLLRLAGATLVMLGAVTVVRGVPVVHEWFHRHTVLPW